MAQASVDNTSTPTKHLTPSEPTATPTILVTVPPSSTPFKVLTLDAPTTIPTETVTPLPTPTLNAEELRQRWQMIDARIAAVMASNNGCQLPCWWGIEPGDLVADAWQIFNTINENGWVGGLPVQWGELQQVGFFDHFYRDEMGEMIYAGFMVDLIVQDDNIKVFDIYDSVGEPQVAGASAINRDWRVLPFGIS